jgi:hypothetical protein
MLYETISSLVSSYLHDDRFSSTNTLQDKILLRLFINKLFSLVLSISQFNIRELEKWNDNIKMSNGEELNFVTD